MATTFTFAFVLAAISLGLLTSHYLAWQRADHGGLPQRELEFHRRQFRRRIFSSGMIGVIGMLMASSVWIEEPFLQLGFWLLIVCLVGWIALSALLDSFATNAHYSSEEAVNTAQLAVLQAEIRRLQAEKNTDSTEKPPRNE